MKKYLKNTSVDAILLIALGLVILINPRGTVSLIGRIIAVIFLLMAANNIIGYAAAKENKSASSLAMGIIQALIGIVLLIKPTIFSNMIPIAAAILIGVGALISLIRAIRLSKTGLTSTFGLVLSIITLVVAILVLLHPSIIVNFFVQLIAIGLIIEGISLLLTGSAD